MALLYDSTVVAAAATTDAAATLATITPNVGRVLSLQVKNTGGTNSADWQLEGTINGTDWVVLQAFAALAAGAVGFYSVQAANVVTVRIRTKSTSSGNSTTVSAAYCVGR